MKDRRPYQAGALAAKAFLCRTQLDTRLHRRFAPMRLRSKIDGMQALPREFRAGFIDAVYVFVRAALAGEAPDPLWWDVLDEVDGAS